MEASPSLPTNKRYGVHFRNHGPTQEILCSAPRYVRDGGRLPRTPPAVPIYSSTATPRVNNEVHNAAQHASPSYYSRTRPALYRSPDSKTSLFLRRTPLPPLPHEQSGSPWGSEVVGPRDFPASPESPSKKREREKEKANEKEKEKPKSKPRGPRSRKTSEAAIEPERTDPATPFESDAFAVYMPTTRVPVMEHSVGFRARPVQHPYQGVGARAGGAVIDGSSAYTVPHSAYTRSPASREQVDAAYQTYKRKAQLVRERHEVEGVRVPEEIVSYAYTPVSRPPVQVEVPSEAETETDTPAAGAFPVSPPLRQTSGREWGRVRADAVTTTRNTGTVGTGNGQRLWGAEAGTMGEGNHTSTPVKRKPLATLRLAASTAKSTMAQNSSNSSRLRTTGAATTTTTTVLPDARDADPGASTLFSTPSPEPKSRLGGTIRVRIKPRTPTTAATTPPVASAAANVPLRQREPVQKESWWGLYNRSRVTASPAQAWRSPEGSRSPSPTKAGYSYTTGNVSASGYARRGDVAGVSATTVMGRDVFGYGGSDIGGTVAGAYGGDGIGTRREASPSKERRGIMPVHEDKQKSKDKDDANANGKSSSSRWAWLRFPKPSHSSPAPAPAPPPHRDPLRQRTRYIDPFIQHATPPTSRPPSPSKKLTRPAPPSSSSSSAAAAQTEHYSKFHNGLTQLSTLLGYVLKLVLLIYLLVGVYFVLDGVREAVRAMGAPWRGMRAAGDWGVWVGRRVWWGLVKGWERWGVKVRVGWRSGWGWWSGGGWWGWRRRGWW